MSRSQASSPPTAPARDRKRGGVALLIVDMINRFDFEGGEALEKAAGAIAGPILDLKAAMKAADAPAIYVNDHFGEWHSEKSRLVARAREHAPELIARIAPADEEYFVIKPQLSAFYATNLPLLLPKLGVSRLVVTGIAADMCVLFTAADAYMRDYALWVPRDAVASRSAEEAERALGIIGQRLHADVASTAELDLESWIGKLDSQGSESRGSA